MSKAHLVESTSEISRNAIPLLSPMMRIIYTVQIIVLCKIIHIQQYNGIQYYINVKYYIVCPRDLCVPTE